MADEPIPQKGRDVTRRELAEALAESTRLNQALKAQLEEWKGQAPATPSESAPAPSGTQSLVESRLRQELADAHRLIAERNVSRRPHGPDPVLVPYSGMVKATADCCVAMGKDGPYHTKAGEVFHVDVPALWTDDPYAAVNVIGTTELGAPITEPNKQAPIPIDFRFRKVVSAAEDPTPRRAAEY